MTSRDARRDGGARSERESDATSPVNAPRAGVATPRVARSPPLEEGVETPAVVATARAAPRGRRRPTDAVAGATALVVANTACIVCRAEAISGARCSAAARTGWGHVYTCRGRRKKCSGDLRLSFGHGNPRIL